MLVILNSRTPTYGRGTYTGYASNATMVNSKVYAKSAMYSEGTVTEGTALDEHTVRHSQPVISYPPSATTGLEYRGNREWTPGTPTSEVPFYEDFSEATSSSNSGFVPSSRIIRSLSPVAEESHEGYHESSIRTASTITTTRTRITGPDMSWESVCTQDLERHGHDIGDIGWDGHVLRWHPGQGRG